MSTNRVAEQLAAIPCVTKYVLIINLFIHGAIFLTDFSVNKVSISAFRVLWHAEYYRMISAAFVHGGIFHILMNMMSLLQIGGNLESQFGTTKFFLITIWGIALSGTFYVCLMWLYSFVDPRQLYQSAVGYSGVLFAYAVMDSFHAYEPTRSVFGFFSVPSKLYPFILLVLLSVFMPGISFVGHLAGICVGVIVVSPLSALFLPSSDAIQSLETHWICSAISRDASYIRYRDKDIVAFSLPPGAGVSSAAGVLGQVSAMFGAVSGFALCFFAHMWNAVATVLFALGCPVDRCSAALSGFWASLVGSWRTGSIISAEDATIPSAPPMPNPFPPPLPGSSARTWGGGQLGGRDNGRVLGRGAGASGSGSSSGRGGEDSNARQTFQV